MRAAGAQWRQHSAADRRPVLALARLASHASSAHPRPLRAGTDDAAEGGRTAALGGDAATSYARLYEALGAALTSERTVLLLYALLHGCPRFQEYCLVRG